MSEKSRARQPRETLAMMLWIGACLAVVGSWLWATHGVEAETPPLVNGLRLCLLIAMFGVFLAEKILAALDIHRAEAASRAVGALARVTDQPEAPRDTPRPILSALALPLLSAVLILNALPDFLALLRLGEVARSSVASAALLAGIAMVVWQLVDTVRQQLPERRGPLVG